jgi:hypothetical protein
MHNSFVLGVGMVVFEAELVEYDEFDERTKMMIIIIDCFEFVESVVVAAAVEQIALSLAFVGLDDELVVAFAFEEFVVVVVVLVVVE